MANDDTCKALACRDPLEKLLADPQTLATNVIDFLLVAGVKGVYHWPRAPSYEASTRLDLIVEARRRVERNGRSDREQRIETRLANVIAAGYVRGNYRSLEEFKNYVAKYHLEKFAVDGAKRFNQWLRRAGLDGFCDETRKWKPGGRDYGPY